MCLLGTLKIVQAGLRLKEVEDGEGCSCRMNMKSLANQYKECVLDAKSNRGSLPLRIITDCRVN